MTRIALIATPILLAACGPRAETEVPDAPADATPNAPASEGRPGPKVNLTGDYRIAGINGADVNQPYAITASITQDRIHVTADCLNFAWAYSVDGYRIATERVAVEGCARGLTVAEEAMVAAFDAATTVAHTPANGIELRGGQYTVILFS